MQFQGSSVSPHRQAHEEYLEEVLHQQPGGQVFDFHAPNIRADDRDDGEVETEPGVEAEAGVDDTMDLAEADQSAGQLGMTVDQFQQQDPVFSGSLNVERLSDDDDRMEEVEGALGSVEVDITEDDVNEVAVVDEHACGGNEICKDASLDKLPVKLSSTSQEDIQRQNYEEHHVNSLFNGILTNEERENLPENENHPPSTGPP
ncbi:uncharacterized protein LOC143230220 isoform X2 [Tachypleus tridentatus]|uniref:uncharacterized protein LOC143230220 isoform X2 n=1 Tax=Tachypleus tridentatus TaxID=6853 RepID=UPI003FD40C2E